MIQNLSVNQNKFIKKISRQHIEFFFWKTQDNLAIKWYVYLWLLAWRHPLAACIKMRCGHENFPSILLPLVCGGKLEWMDLTVVLDWGIYPMLGFFVKQENPNQKTTKAEVYVSSLVHKIPILFSFLIFSLL